MNSLTADLLSIWEKINHLLAKSKKIIILGHINPDGDSIGAQQALFFALRKKYPQKVLFAPFAAAQGLEFLLPTNYQNHLPSLNASEANLFFLVDFHTLTRSPLAINDQLNSIVAIDHHPLAKTNLAHISWIDSQFSSACEMIYLFLVNNNYLLDKKIATLLLTGMITDTGNFTFPNTQSRTLAIASQLVKLGANLNLIHQKLNHHTLQDLKIKAFLFANFTVQNKVGYCFFSPQDALAFPWLKENKEVSKFIDFFAFLQGVEIWFLVVQVSREKEIACSMRSKKLTINQLASKYGGGGHQLAAGVKLKNWGEVKKLLSDLKQLIN